MPFPTDLNTLLAILDPRMFHVEHTPLSDREFGELCQLALREWDENTGVPSLDTIRSRGSRAQLTHAVNLLCDHDDERRAASEPLPVPHLTAARGD